MPVGYELFDRINVRSGNKWFSGCITDSIYEDGILFLVIDYVNTEIFEIAQAIVNMSYAKTYLRS